MTEHINVLNLDLPEIADRDPYQPPTKHLEKTGAKTWAEVDGRREGRTLLVNQVRPAVNAWRAAGYPGVTASSRRLLAFWFEDDDTGLSPDPINPVAALLGKAPKPNLDTATPMLERIKRLPNLLVMNDEAHHVHDEDLAWSKTLMALHANLKAKGTGDVYNEWIAIAVERWRERAKDYGAVGEKPLLFVMAESTKDADSIAERLRREPEFKGAGRVLVILEKEGVGIPTTVNPPKPGREIFPLRDRLHLDITIPRTTALYERSFTRLAQLDPLWPCRPWAWRKTWTGRCATRSIRSMAPWT